MRTRIYLAGPDVFRPNALEIGARKKAICAQYGAEGLFPIDNEVSVHVPQASKAIFAGNIEMLESCDVVLANLTPFRGVGADQGTAFEIGYAHGRGKAIHGYSLDARTLLDRLRQLGAAQRGQTWVDQNDDAIENFGLIDNLMLVEAIGFSGGVLTTLESDLDEFALFEHAVRRLVDMQTPSHRRRKI